MTQEQADTITSDRNIVTELKIAQQQVLLPILQLATITKLLTYPFLEGDLFHYGGLSQQTVPRAAA